MVSIGRDEHWIPRRVNKKAHLVGTHNLLVRTNFIHVPVLAVNILQRANFIWHPTNCSASK